MRRRSTCCERSESWRRVAKETRCGRFGGNNQAKGQTPAVAGPDERRLQVTPLAAAGRGASSHTRRYKNGQRE